MGNDKKLTGVSIYGFLVTLFGIGYFLAALSGVVIFEGKLILPQRIGCGVAGLIFIFLGIGILKMNEIARKAIFVLSAYLGFTVIREIVKLFSSSEKDLFLWVYYLIFFIICISPIIYFTRPAVKKSFAPTRKD